MDLLPNDAGTTEFRNGLMRFLNEYGLDATAILSIARRAEPVRYEANEAVLSQGKFENHIFFLVSGTIVISLRQHEREEVLGERSAVTLLGEISYFNKTPATATVRTKGPKPAIILRLSYDDFTEVLDEFPQIQPTLARIGEMRMISQLDGFIGFERFMSMIGRRRNRLPVNRALYHHLEDAITLRLLPQLNEQSRILEVADGPGIICELLREHREAWVPNLFIQATHLEDAVLNPLQSFASDFSRAAYLRDRFDAIIALQVFEHVGPDQIGEQFRRAAQLLKPGGLLLVVRLRIVDVAQTVGGQDTSLFFQGLESIVRRLWPGIIDTDPLIQVSFVDADIDPMMEWSPQFCDAVIERKLEPPPKEQGVERVLLEVLLQQARRRQFDPEEINFHWLAWHASHFKLNLEESHQNSELAFYYQLYRIGTDEAKG